MNSKIITGPSAMISALRAFFVENSVERFSEDRSDEFCFLTNIDGTGVAVAADTKPGIPRLHLLTTILVDVEVPAEQCENLCNFVNTHNWFATAVLPAETGRFALESTLPIADGRCLEAQLFTFVHAHMSIVAVFAPMLGAFARGELNREQFEEQLDVLIASRESPAEETNPRRRGSPPSRLLAPGRN